MGELVVLGILIGAGIWLFKAGKSSGSRKGFHVGRTAKGGGTAPALVEGTTVQDWSLSSAEFEAASQAAEALCKSGKHAEAVDAWLRLGASRSDPRERYQALSSAAECVRLHHGSEAKALELCRQIDAGPYAKAARARIYQWATSPEQVLADLGEEDFSAWPEELAAIGYAVRGAAHFQLEHGPQAARDYLRAFQFAKSAHKWSAFQRLGDTCWKLLDDPVLAEACYRKCMADFGGGWTPGRSIGIASAFLQSLSVPAPAGEAALPAIDPAIRSAAV